MCDGAVSCSRVQILGSALGWLIEDADKLNVGTSILRGRVDVKDVAIKREVGLLLGYGFATPESRSCRLR